tara:strand:- start:753 stop:1121 length:369 start_codon:yes stop_codon:yes gene_type:complete
LSDVRKKVIQDPRSRTKREEEIFQTLHDVQDAEFDIDIVDMGLIYGVHFDEREQSVIVDMTFTSMACPAIDFMSEDVIERLNLEKDIKNVSINVVWDPPWNQEMLSEDGVEGLNDWGVIKWV